MSAKMGDIIDFDTGKRFNVTHAKASSIDYTLNMIKKDKHKYVHILAVVRDEDGVDHWFNSEMLPNTMINLLDVLNKEILGDLLDDDIRGD
jgi:hypothetical protein